MYCETGDDYFVWHCSLSGYLVMFQKVSSPLSSRPHHYWLLANWAVSFLEAFDAMLYRAYVEEYEEVDDKDSMAVFLDFHIERDGSPRIALSIAEFVRSLVARFPDTFALLENSIQLPAEKQVQLPAQPATPASVPQATVVVRRQRGTTRRTQDRALSFRKLKDEHPTWSLAKVAMEAGRIDGCDYTEDTVRNAYRSMGWKWERSDRVR